MTQSVLLEQPSADDLTTVRNRLTQLFVRMHTSAKEVLHGEGTLPLSGGAFLDLIRSFFTLLRQKRYEGTDGRVMLKNCYRGATQVSAKRLSDGARTMEATKQLIGKMLEVRLTYAVKSKSNRSSLRNYLCCSRSLNRK